MLDPGPSSTQSPAASVFIFNCPISGISRGGLHPRCNLHLPRALLSSSSRVGEMTSPLPVECATLHILRPLSTVISSVFPPRGGFFCDYTSRGGEIQKEGVSFFFETTPRGNTPRGKHEKFTAQTPVDTPVRCNHHRQNLRATVQAAEE